MCSIQKRCPHAFQRSIIEWFHCNNNYHKSKKKKKQVKVIDYLILKDEVGLAVLIRKQTSSRDMWYLPTHALLIKPYYYAVVHILHYTHNCRNVTV